MRHSTIAVGLMLAFLMPLAGFASSPSTVQRQIQALLDEQMVASNAHDTDRFLANCMHGPELLFILDGYAADGIVIHGWDALRAQQLKWWQKTDVLYRAHGTVEFQPVSVDMEIVTEPLTSHRTLPNGQASDRNFVVTMVWKRTPVGWRVIYWHESWIL